MSGIALGLLTGMVAADLTLHIVDLTYARLWNRRLLIFRSWRSYDHFWIAYWSLALLLCLVIAVST